MDQGYPKAVRKPKGRLGFVGLSMVLALMAGCSSGGGGTAKAPDAATATATPAPAPNVKQPEAKPQPPLEIQMTARLFEEAPNMDNPYWKEFMKRTNTKLNIEWIPDGDYTTKLNLLLASGNIPEVLVINNLKHPPVVNAVKNGAFWDLTPFLGDFSKYPNLKNFSAPDSWVTSRILGKNYAIPKNRPQLSGGPKIRKDWLDKLGIPMPQTLDEYRSALKKIVDADIDGNGKKDTIGLVSKASLFSGGSAGGFGDAFGTGKPTFNEEGGLIYETLTPQHAELIAWLRDLYADGVLAKEFAVMKPTQATELFESGKAASLINESFRWDYPFMTSIKKVQPDAIVDTVPPLKGPGGYAVRYSTGVDGAFLISKKVPEDKVKRILDYLEMTNTKEYYDFSVNGLEGIHFNRVNGEIQLTDQHKKDVGSTSPWQPIALYYDKYGKIVTPTAPKEYNDAKIKQVESQGYFEKGLISPFSVINSATWIATWPKFEQEWTSMAVKAVVGQISMDEYKAYVKKINDDPNIKKAYQEFAKDYKETYGK
ncbi:extracellular solute-binding protein [Paenibacillus cremeus]|uniref:Extracellular solute-binding protein n=1 Tax=Paenibacillus cremeus TaxID=2163881 RepID=A0A559KAQ3_9BACL|nr:extracellular solute-binding protein [Paenibacillus cremeus]TVY09206.1 extracellular solute-binding protein [Paenibacillus cremeus]